MPCNDMEDTFVVLVRKANDMFVFANDVRDYSRYRPGMVDESLEVSNRLCLYPELGE